RTRKGPPHAGAGRRPGAGARNAGSRPHAKIPAWPHGCAEPKRARRARATAVVAAAPHAGRKAPLATATLLLYENIHAQPAGTAGAPPDRDRRSAGRARDRHRYGPL